MRRRGQRDYLPVAFAVCGVAFISAFCLLVPGFWGFISLYVRMFLGL